ncbi:hypothetical protein MRX96_037397 [Rhipicephalus microplus]
MLDPYPLVIGPATREDGRRALRGIVTEASQDLGTVQYTARLRKKRSAYTRRQTVPAGRPVKRAGRRLKFAGAAPGDSEMRCGYVTNPRFAACREPGENAFSRYSDMRSAPFRFVLWVDDTRRESPQHVPYLLAQW